MLSAQLVRSDENCPSTDRPMPTTAIFNPTRPRHIKHCPYRKLDPFVRCDQSRSRLSIRRPAEQRRAEARGLRPRHYFMRLRVPWPDAGEGGTRDAIPSEHLMRERSAPQNRLSAETKEGIGSRGVAQERHGLFRSGAFAAARVRRPSIQNIRERYSDHPPARIPARLTSSRLVSSAAPRLFCLPMHVAQQCGPFATYRPVSCLPASTICGCITAHRSDDWQQNLPEPHCGADFMVPSSCFTIRGPLL